MAPKRSYSSMFGAAASAANGGYQIARKALRLTKALRGRQTGRTGRTVKGGNVQDGAGTIKSKSVYKGKKKLSAAGKRQRIFKKKVIKAMNAGGPMSMLHEKTTDNVSTKFLDFVNTLGTAISDRTQLVIGAQLFFLLGFRKSTWSASKILNEVREYNQVNNGAITALTSSIASLNKIHVQYHCARYCFENRSTRLDLIMDVYEFVATKSHSDEYFITPYNTLLQNDSVGFPSKKISNMGDSRYDEKGITPLDFPGMGDYWKLVKKTRVVVPHNSTEGINPYVNYNMYTRPYSLYDSVAEPSGTRVMKGITKGLLIIVAPDSISGGYQTDEDIIRIGVSHITHFKIENRGGSGYVPKGLSSLLSHDIGELPV